MMGIALGGVGVISLRVPWTLTSTVVQQLDLSSLILATFLVVVFLLIAYFTNPDEASFRTFLTELAFRQHLSRLSGAHVDHDELDDETGPQNAARPLDDQHPSKHDSGHKNPSDNSKPPSESSRVVFHFANKVSVTMRTPSYDLRSFGVLTIALVPPAEMAISPSLNSAHGQTGQTPKPISWSNPTKHGTCFIGALGRWWLGLEINMQSRQVRVHPQNDDTSEMLESSRSRPEDGEPSNPRQDDVPFVKSSKPGFPRRTSTTASSRTKAALRERISLQTQLAAKREQPALPARPSTPPPLPKSASLPLHAIRVPPPSPELRRGKNSAPNNQPLLPTNTAPPLQPQMQAPPQDQSPILAELLQQLDAARSATSDLHAQLQEVHAASERTAARLQTEVATARETKKREDEGRAAVKARTKVLDDARRQADSNKREAEKRLKAATARRDSTTNEFEKLDRAVEKMKCLMEGQVMKAKESGEKTKEESAALEAQLLEKKTQLNAAEDDVQVLSARARELESAIAEELEKLEKHKAQKESGPSWPPPLSGKPSPQARVSALSPVPLSLPVPIRSSSLDTPSQFQPFSESPVNVALSPVTTSLIPSSLMHSMENPLQEVPRLSPYFSQSNASSTIIPALLTRYDQSSNIGPQRSIRFDEQRDDFSEPQKLNAFFRPRPPSPAVPAPKHRRWFMHSKEKGLNPDAKVFTLPARPTLLASNQHCTSDPGPTYSDIFHPASSSTSLSQDLRAPDSSNNNFPSASDIFHPPTTILPDFTKAIISPNASPPPRMSLAGSLFPSLHNPFSPSPAEREALQRALSSRNPSKEKITVGGNLERVSSNGSGSSGSLQSSPHWPHGQATRYTSHFNPWASERKE